MTPPIASSSLAPEQFLDLAVPELDQDRDAKRCADVRNGWKVVTGPVSFPYMLPDPLPLSPRRFKFAWKLFKSWRAEARSDFERAIRLLDEAAEIMPLTASDRVQRAMFLLKSQRTGEAHVAFAALRDEFKGSEDPDLRYLWHYCTTMLSMLVPGSGQWSYEARQAKLIDCRRSIRLRFPMVTVDEIHDAIRPRS